MAGTRRPHPPVAQFGCCPGCHKPATINRSGFCPECTAWVLATVAREAHTSRWSQ